MEVRRLTAKELDEYFALRLEMLQNSPDSFLVTYEEEVEKGPDYFSGLLTRNEPHNTIFGGYLDGKLCGAAGVFREDRHSRTSHKATLWGMYVKPSARRAGLGRELISAVIGHARGVMGASSLYLCVESTNKKAQSLYERMGFKVWGSEPKAYFIDGTFRTDNHLWLDLG